MTVPHPALLLVRPLLCCVLQSHLMAENSQHQLYPNPAVFAKYPDAEHRLGFLGRWGCSMLRVAVRVVCRFPHVWFLETSAGNS